MTDKEKAEEYELDCIADVYEGDVCNIPYAYSGQTLEKAYLAGLAEGRKEKCLEQNKDGTIRPCEVMKDISVLLSCSNCSENKGGYICDKEYNDKCLTQKIEYIKELKKENEELKAQIEKMKSITEELIKIQSLSIKDSYNAGLFNGFVIVFNSIFEEKYQCCKWNEKKNKWELAE